MRDIHYPTVDLKFLMAKIRKSPKLEREGMWVEEGVLTVIVKGPQPVIKWRIRMGEAAPGELSLENATPLAWRFAFLGDLMRWLEENRIGRKGAMCSGNKPLSLRVERGETGEAAAGRA